LAGIGVITVRCRQQQYFSPAACRRPRRLEPFARLDILFTISLFRRDFAIHHNLGLATMKSGANLRNYQQTMQQWQVGPVPDITYFQPSQNTHQNDLQ
jgi:hypothetical protein